jgi:hypothetical protein
LKLPATIPPVKQALLQQVVDELSQLSEIVAVALGGSYARGAERPDSDLDVGIYYAEARPFAIAEIRRIASQLAPNASPTVTDFYEWGRWVNGGAWINTPSGKVDFLYRNLDQVERTIREAQQGILHYDYLQQPPYGFPSIIYLAETSICVPLYDPEARIAALKEQVATYSPRLQESLIGWLGIAEFSLLHAYSFAQNGDVYNTTGCLTRIAAVLTQVLFALNQSYFISDKGALDAITTFAVAPQNYKEQISILLAHPGYSATELTQSVTAMHSLWQEVVTLTGGRYQPRFNLQPV